MIPLALFRLPSELLHVYCAVRSFDWQKDGEERTGCTASAKTIAERIGKGERQTRDNLQRLADCGAVRLEPQKGEAPRVLCTPEGFDPAKLTPAVHRRTPNPGSPPPGGAAADRRGVRQSTAGVPRQSTADEVETVSRNKKQRQEVKTARPRRPTAAVLPDWMPAATWEAWKAHRRAKKAPLTPHAEALCLRKLERWRGEGHDPVALVELAIERGWQGLFLPTDQQRGRAPGRLGDDEARKLFDEGTNR